MTISELEMVVKTTGLIGFETQLGYVVFPTQHFPIKSEWIVNVVGEILVIRNVRYNKQLHKISYGTKFKCNLNEIDPKTFELELVEINNRWNKLNKQQKNDAMLEQLKEDFV